MIDQSPQIVPYRSEHLESILELTARAWSAVFPLMKQSIPNYVYRSFYPDGWQKRQLADVEAICRDDETSVWVTLLNDEVTGYLGLRAHHEDSMGEIYIIAVDPAYQRQGIGSALMSFAFDWMRKRKLAMAMVETGGDEGHAPARLAYMNAGFERISIARYFREL